MSEDFNNYFHDNYDYPSEQIMDGDAMLEPNTCYNYISSTFLNGIINYVKPIKAYIIDRYFYDREEFQGQPDPYHKARIQARDNEGNWIDYEFDTKKEAIDFLHSNDYEMFHSKLDCFNDDVLLLGKTEKYYWYFWFDGDVSDCSVGRFTTDDPEETIIERFTKHAKDVSETGEIYEYELPWIKGWISW